MPLKLHVGCGTVYLDGYVNLDVPVEGYSFLARERPDLTEKNRTSVDRYYKQEESRESLDGRAAQHPTKREPQFCVVDTYAEADRLPYRPESVDEIRSVQCLEHLPMNQAPQVLRYWYE